MSQKAQSLSKIHTRRRNYVRRVSSLVYIPFTISTNGGMQRKEAQTLLFQTARSLSKSHLRMRRKKGTRVCFLPYTRLTSSTPSGIKHVAMQHILFRNTNKLTMMRLALLPRPIYKKHTISTCHIKRNQKLLNLKQSYHQSTCKTNT